MQWYQSTFLISPLMVSGSLKSVRITKWPNNFLRREGQIAGAKESLVHRDSEITVAIKLGNCWELPD